MANLIGEPIKEYPQFEAALCLLPVLPPDEALALLRLRLRRIAQGAFGLAGILLRRSANPALCPLTPFSSGQRAFFASKRRQHHVAPYPCSF